MRFVLAGTEIVMMVAESPPEQCAALRTRIPAFLSSLEIRQ